MSPDALELLAPLIALLGTGAMILVGMKIRLSAKRGASRSSEEMERLAESVDELFEQNRALKDEVAELQERLDFHERLLVEGGKKELADTPV